MLRRSAELDLEDYRQVAVSPKALEMQVRDLPQTRDGRVQIRKLTAAVRDKSLHRAIKDRMQDLVFALEVEIDRPVCDPSLSGDVRHLGIEVPALGEHP